MKSVIIMTVLFLLPLNFARSQDPMLTDVENSGESGVTTDELLNDNSENFIEDEFYSNEPDIFSRKLYQKTLKTLSNKEKVIWSFKMADKDIFL